MNQIKFTRYKEDATSRKNNIKDKWHTKIDAFRYNQKSQDTESKDKIQFSCYIRQEKLVLVKV